MDEEEEDEIERKEIKQKKVDKRVSEKFTNSEKEINSEEEEEREEFSQKYQMAKDLFSYEDNEELQDDYEETEDSESKTKYSKLSTIFEKEVLENQFLTEKDEVIQKTDIPERFQLVKDFNIENERKKRLLKDTDVLEEAEWIVEHAFEKYFSYTNTRYKDHKQNHVKAVVQVLLFILNDNFDIPFIAQYRKEEFQSVFLVNQNSNEKELKIEEELEIMNSLWKIYDYDIKWYNLNKKKQTILSNYTNIGENMKILLEEIHTIQEINDIEDYLNLNSERPLVNNEKKKHTKTDMYTFAKKSNLDNYKIMFGFSSSSFSNNILKGYLKEEIKDELKSPYDMACDFICSEFDTPERVMMGGRYLLAMEISKEPFVVNELRNIYKRFATLKLKITNKGKKKKF
jgi:transcription elongation factor SPT6